MYVNNELHRLSHLKKGGDFVEAEFFLRKIRNDFAAVYKQNQVDGKVGADVLNKVLERWDNALNDEKDALNLAEGRFQSYLDKPGRLTPEEGLQAFELVMEIHKPLIKGRNDVIGHLLQDNDTKRIFNKIAGRDTESGFQDSGFESVNELEHTAQRPAYETELPYDENGEYIDENGNIHLNIDPGDLM